MLELFNKKGKKIPHIGLGTYPFQGMVMANLVKDAVNVGYRLFDTSDDYRGESGIGLAIKELADEKVISREDLFIQTKISDNNAYAYEPLKGKYFNPNSKVMQRHTVSEIVREKVEVSLRELGTNYLDSLLIHYPFPYYTIDIWKEFIKLKEEGVVRYIGVSNFNERHIAELIDNTGVAPEINECYASPIGTKQSLVDYCEQNNCLFVTYSPLMDLSRGVIPKDKLQPIADKYGKSLAQIVLRWNVERGCLPLPKTKNPRRLAENFDIFDFVLSKEDAENISALNFDYQYIVESRTCPGL